MNYIPPNNIADFQLQNKGRSRFYVTTQKYAEKKLRKVSCSLYSLGFLCDRSIIKF